jgi:membrane protease YdiL (CAAX protease family)
MDHNQQSRNDHLSDMGIILLGAAIGTVFGLLFLETAVWGTVIGLMAAMIFGLGRYRRRKSERKLSGGSLRNYREK